MCIYEMHKPFIKLSAFIKSVSTALAYNKTEEKLK